MINGNMENVANNILHNNMKGINMNDVEIKPCNQTVVVKFYDDNPYRCVETDKSGLILGIESTKRYKSNETGEMEDSEEYIACAKVIATGPKCQNVEPGDDVFCTKYIAHPLPFRQKGYEVLDENNIICKIVNK